MRLNPGKCAFGVRAGKFWGFTVSERGIRVNLEKIRVILDMPPPKTIKDIQCLTGSVVALNRDILSRVDTSRRMTKWGIKLAEFGIEYAPQKVIKAQILADFMAECSFDRSPIPAYGSKTKKGSGACVLLLDPDEKYELSFGFQASNNAAEYEALISGLQLA
ncbi:retrovirus-related Pol polyprotein from transposon gypsy [Gossypium australe]|uniref:Retrovirus-related Pol polyprotein from transposon gypsy n=1 Tax=Gossypium australe TaxID=47621 RepID=A0A5B6WDC2_9ROSI|nr:retrovirus-related Pol polyprotein from transposon gypsy [Gossypium australe]